MKYNTTRHTPKIGTVSHGTGNPRDLIPTFLQEIRYLASIYTHTAEGSHARDHAISEVVGKMEGSPLGTLLMRETLDWSADISDDPQDHERLDTYLDSEECGLDLEALFEALDDLAPDGMYFGSLEGDGSDFGFWICWEND